jgi:hypothetical protein
MAIPEDFQEFARSLEGTDVLNSFENLRPHQIHQLCRDYEGGKTAGNLAPQYQISKTTVCRVLKACGIEPTRKDLAFTRRIDITEAQRSEVAEMFKAAQQSGNKPSLLSIHKATGVPYSMVLMILHDLGLRVWRHRQHTERKTTPARQQVMKLVIEDWKKGNVTKRDLARIYKVSPQTVEYWLNKAGFGTVNSANKPVVPDNPELTAPGSKAGLFRKMCKEASPQLLQLLIDRAKDPDITPRDLAAIFMAVSDRGYGKPKDTEETNNEAPTSASERILKALPPGIGKILNQG